MESETIFPHQQELPPLPLPALSDTLERYLSSVKPVLNEAEFAHTSAVVAEFGREDGEGEALQTFLEDKAESERNWMYAATSFSPLAAPAEVAPAAPTADSR